MPRPLAVLAASVAAVLGLASPSWAAITGPDVSKWQHPNNASIDWQQVRQSGQLFAFVKATEGPGPRTNGAYYTSEYFASDWAAAKAAGLSLGAYHYAQPGASPSIYTNAIRQARYYVSVVGTLHGATDLPPVLDLETTNGLSATQAVQWTSYWLNEVQRLTGRQPMIYTYQYFWQHDMGDTHAFTGYRLWFARYTNDPSQVVPPGGWPVWTFWQYTSTGHIPGISTEVDISRYCCSLANFRALANGSAASPAASNPFGHVGAPVRIPGGLLVGGWAIDPDTTDPIAVHAYVDGKFNAMTTADQPSADVEIAYPGFGDHHRYTVPVTMPDGRRQVCVYGINTGYGSFNPKLGCQTVVLSPTPFGNLDGLERVPGGVLVGGWAIDPDVADPIDVHVHLDGRLVGATPANQQRADVGAAYPGYGDAHGYTTFVPTAPGHHDVCTFGINAGQGSTSPKLACRGTDVTVDPFGAMDPLSVQPDGSVTVSGWAIDPDVADPIRVHVYVDGRWSGAMTASLNRPGVGQAFPAYGAEHGFSFTLAGLHPGQRVCVYGINAGQGTANPRLACRTL